MTCKILRLFFNTLAADDKHSLVKRENLTKPIQMHLSQKQKAVSRCLRAFSKSTLNFERFPEKIPLIAYVFPNLQTPEDVAR